MTRKQVQDILLKTKKKINSLECKIKYLEDLIETTRDGTIQDNVQNYSELLTVVDPDLYQFAYVRESQGIKWLPGSMGGTYYGSGLYMWDGTNWIEDDTDIFTELQVLTDGLSAEQTARQNADTNLQNQIDSIDIAETFETVSKNLEANPFSVVYSGDNISTITYSTGLGNIVKTLNYTGENLTSVVLSGATPSGIDLTKSFSYSGEDISSVNYF